MTVHFDPSLILGVASAASSGNEALVAGVAGLVAGAMSMAAGEYVSVSSQSDTEHADLARETKELASDPDFEKEELAQIYAARGVEIGLARQVAQQLMTKDALGAHSHDELGISAVTTARPVQAAMTSAATFTVGAAAPLILVLVSPANGFASGGCGCKAGLSAGRIAQAIEDSCGGCRPTTSTSTRRTPMTRDPARRDVGRLRQAGESGKGAIYRGFQLQWLTPGQGTEVAGTTAWPRMFRCSPITT